MKNIIILFIITFCFTSVHAQKMLSLSDAINIGLENNYNLKVQENSEKIAKINNTWGNTGIVPTLSFNASMRENFNYNDKENYRAQTIVPDLSLNWLVFNGFSAKINKKRFEELEQKSQGNTAILVENTIQDIIMAYNNCLLQKEMVSVFKKLADLSGDRYNRAVESKKIGASTTYEITTAKTSWLEDQSNYLQQKTTFTNAVRTLNFVLAVDGNEQWELSTTLETTVPDYKIEDLETKLLAGNATLKNQYLYQSLLAKETSLAKSSYSPSISLNAGIRNSDMGNYYTKTTPNFTQNSSDAYLGLTFSWSIFNGGIRKRSVEIAKINQESAQVQTGQMKHSLKNQLLQTYSNYEVQKALLDLANEREISAKLNLNLSKEKYKNGSINSFNYRDVQIIYMNAAINQLRATFNLINSNTDLLRITGGIISEYE